jgi:hypothetical protein
VGRRYGIKCSGDYCVAANQGAGMMYSPHALFLVQSDDLTQNWSIAFPDESCEPSKPLLLGLVRSKRINERALALIQARYSDGKLA